METVMRRLVGATVVLLLCLVQGVECWTEVHRYSVGGGFFLVVAVLIIIFCWYFHRQRTLDTLAERRPARCSPTSYDQPGRPTAPGNPRDQYVRPPNPYNSGYDQPGKTWISGNPPAYDQPGKPINPCNPPLATKPPQM